MKQIDDAIKELQTDIERRETLISSLDENRDYLRSLCAAVGDMDPYISVYPSLHKGPNFDVTLTVSVCDLAAEMATILETLDTNTPIPLDSWETRDLPESRRRIFTTRAVPWDELHIHAVLAEDSFCRVEVIAYEQKKTTKVVEVTESVPVTRLICGGSSHD